MTAQEIIEKIRAEIERQEKQCPLDTYEGRHKLFILGGLKTFLSDLEKEEKPSEGLEEEADKLSDALFCEFFPQDGDMITPNDFRVGLRKFARHFYELGCRRTAEKYDEIEYKRQRADVCKELEEEINRMYAKDNVTMRTREQYGQLARHFAQWQKEKDTRDMYMSDSRLFKKVYELGKKDMKQEMMKEAIDAEFCSAGMFMPMIDFKDKRMEGIKYGDSIKVIVIKEE